MRIALIGFGGVGKALLRLLQDKREDLLSEGINPKVTYILASRGGLFCPDGVDSQALFDHLEKGGRVDNFASGGCPELTPDYLAQHAQVDVAIDLLPTNKHTGQPGLSCVQQLLDRGIHVILADKGPAMLAYHDLARRANDHGVQLGLGCTTGGAPPEGVLGRVARLAYARRSTPPQVAFFGYFLGETRKYRPRQGPEVSIRRLPRRFAPRNDVRFKKLPDK